MNECDILEIVKILKSAVKSNDWDEVEDAINYLEEYTDEVDGNEDY